MYLKYEEKMREKFCDLLKELSKSQEQLKDNHSKNKYYKQLEKLYYPNGNTELFRHYYSDIFSLLTSLSEDCSVDVLGQNLSILYNDYDKYRRATKANIDISSSLKKLYDHVNLDIARIKYIDGTYYKISSDINLSDISHNVEVLRNKIEKLENTVEKTSELAEKTEEKMNDAQKEYITILGIFSSIIITFIGGIVFSSSVLENIHKSSIYRILFISLIIGFVLINVIYILFYFMFLIIKKENKSYGSCWIIILINAIIIIAAIFAFCSWKFGWIEKRDQEVKNMIEPTTISSIEESSTTTNKK